MRVGTHVAFGRVCGGCATWESFSRCGIRVVVVREQDVTCGPQVRCPVLRLAVGAHDAVVAADAEVVFGRDAAGVVQGLLSGEHHGTVGGHHQDALGVGEHRGFGVPVRLCADVDACDDDVDLTAGLGEGDDATQAA